MVLAPVLLTFNVTTLLAVFPLVNFTTTWAPVTSEKLPPTVTVLAAVFAAVLQTP